MTAAPPPTVGDALRDAQERLARAEIDAPRIQALALLGHAVGRDRAGVLSRLSEELSSEQARRFVSLVERRLNHEPLQYLLERASFLDFEVAVGPGVFIPRPETEAVVERALHEWPPESTLAIDLCTGSGAIAIALARARPHARVVAVDLSPIALRATVANAEALGVGARVIPVRADLLTAFRAGVDAGVLVCNPPYAPLADVVQPEVRDHEPVTAWSPGPLGTEVYERLAYEAADLLRPGCRLILELGYGQELAVRSLLEADGRWGEVTVEPDFQGIPRVLTASRRTAIDTGT